MRRTKKKQPAKWRNPVVSAVTNSEVVAALDRAAEINRRHGRKDLNTRSKVAGKVLELGLPTFAHLYPDQEQAV